MGAPAGTLEVARVERLASRLRELELELLLVTLPVNVRYLTGFTGSNGLALIGASGDSTGRTRHRFLTDFRYAEQSAAQVPGAFEREIVPVELLDALARLLGEPAAGASGRLGFDDAAMTVRQHARLRELLAPAWELVPSGGVVEALREVKDALELARIRAAAELADEALRGVLEQGLAGRTERDVATQLELAMRTLGAAGASFPAIVAAGEHSALPHAEPREVLIPRDALITIDWGAQLDGYCSDCTRVFATGGVTDEQVDVYELVLRAQESALVALRPGISGRALDGVARAVIEAAGHGGQFGHGLGHGVGMEIHEAPRLSRLAGDAPLRAGNVVTIEPGVYVPGRFGVRIEDLVAVTESGWETMSTIAKQLTAIE